MYVYVAYLYAKHSDIISATSDNNQHYFDIILNIYAEVIKRSNSSVASFLWQFHTISIIFVWRHFRFSRVISSWWIPIILPEMFIHHPFGNSKYRAISNIRRTKSHNLNVSRLAVFFAESIEARC